MRTRCSVARWSTRSPASRTSPAESRSEPAMALSKVLFPAPFGPTTVTISPRLTSRDTSLMIGTVPYPASAETTSRCGRAGLRSSGNVGLFDLGKCPHLGQAALGDHVAARHHHHSLAHLLDDAQLMLDHQHGKALFTQCP